VIEPIARFREAKRGRVIRAGPGVENPKKAIAANPQPRIGETRSEGFPAAETLNIPSE